MWTTSPGTLRPFNSFLILLNLEKDRSPEQLVTIKLRNKTARGWIHRRRTTNLRHQTSDPNAALSFSCCLFTLCLLGYNYVVAIWQSDFCLLNSSSFFFICLAWEQYKLAQIVYSVAIWFLNDWIETQIKKILKLWSGAFPTFRLTHT